MKGKYDIPSLYLVGFEGLFGALLCVLIFLPAVYLIPGNDHGSYENFINSAYMMFNNWKLLLFQSLYFVSISFFNFMAMTISKLLSATHRALLDAMRTASVWIIMVILFYATYSASPATGDVPYGEPLNFLSFIELFGFGVMFCGTIVHNNVNGAGDWLMRETRLGSEEVACCNCNHNY